MEDPTAAPDPQQIADALEERVRLTEAGHAALVLLEEQQRRRKARARREQAIRYLYAYACERDVVGCEREKNLAAERAARLRELLSIAEREAVDAYGREAAAREKLSAAWSAFIDAENEAVRLGVDLVEGRDAEGYYHSDPWVTVWCGNVPITRDDLSAEAARVATPPDTLKLGGAA